MILKYGNLMDQLSSYSDVCITTNSFVKTNGELVMGRGFAKQMADLYPQLAFHAGQEILKWNQEFNTWDGLDERVGTPDPYGFLHLTRSHTCVIRPHRIHLFQVKKYWGDDATLELVKRSVDMMQAHVRGTERFGRTFALNYPAIGNGKLKKSEIEPIIATLPDNVDVWQYDHSNQPLEDTFGDLL
jgi:hypothetical protein